LMDGQTLSGNVQARYTAKVILPSTKILTLVILNKVSVVTVTSSHVCHHLLSSLKEFRIFLSMTLLTRLVAMLSPSTFAVRRRLWLLMTDSPMMRRRRDGASAEAPKVMKSGFSAWKRPGLRFMEVIRGLKEELAMKHYIL